MNEALLIGELQQMSIDLQQLCEDNLERGEDW